MLDGRTTLGPSVASKLQKAAEFRMILSAVERAAGNEPAVSLSGQRAAIAANSQLARQRDRSMAPVMRISDTFMTAACETSRC